MRLNLENRARRLWPMLAAASVGLNACRSELVSPDHSGNIIDETAASDPTSANGLRIGALGALRLQTGGGGPESIWQLGGLLADEWKSASPNAATNEIDKRTVSTNNESITTAYNGLQQTRGYFRDAINAMATFRPYDGSWRGELYFGLGFVELQMAEDFCNGIPFGSVVNSKAVYGAPQTDEAALNLAIAHFDSALALVGGTDSAAVRVKPAVLIAKARALVDLSKFSDAAALVPASAVATSYQYTLTFSTASGLNGNWNLNTNLAQYTLSDSAEGTAVLKNALPFVSAKDSRVTSTNPNKRGADGSTALVTQSVWSNTGQIPLVNGVDARLIEAEAKLKANDLAGMLATLNALRTAQQTLGTFKPAVLPALPASAATNAAAAAATFFREKAFWTFGRGQRLGDLRRQLRQYTLPSTSVFPTGSYFKGGTYGSDVNFPVPDAERANPLFNGCIDRNA